jgi:hypothetical protein
MNNFLPVNYSVPKSQGNYTKLEQGDTTLRILASPIIGWLGWIGKEPKRFRMDDKPVDLRPFERQEAKHFWAMPVYNYKLDRIQIWEVTQVGIQTKLEEYAKDDDWGSPVNRYDIKITRIGEGMETKYSVIAKPHSETKHEIKEKFEMTPINLEALYTGDDPFSTEKQEIIDDIPFDS